MSLVLRLVPVAGALLSCSCSATYDLRQVNGEVPLDATPVIRELAADARDGCAEGLEPLVHCEVASGLCRQDPLTGHAASDRLCSALKPLVTFAHLSDALVRDERVTLDGPWGAPGHRHLGGGVRRSSAQVRYEYAVLLGTLLGVNRLAGSDGAGRLHGAHPSGAGSFSPSAYAPCPAPLPPSFVLHTGSAVDAGLLSELSQFLTIASESEVPFFNTVGSHDALFFGIFPGSALRGLDVALPSGPVDGLDAFLRAHGPVPARADRSCRPPGPGEVPAPCWGSRHFGFDLICPTATAASPSDPRGLCTDARGYYAQDIVLSNDTRGRRRKLRLLVLNTAEVAPADLSEAIDQASRGRMRDEQYLWLRRELSLGRDESTVFLVAGHHDLASFVDAQQGWLRDALVEEPRVLAYLAGHTHVNRFERTPRPGGAPLLEVVAGSTLVYPQLGNLVDLLESGPGELYLRIRSFRQRVGDAWCGNECSLKYLAASGRNGAYNDRSAPDRRDEDVAVRNANGLFGVSGFD